MQTIVIDHDTSELGYETNEQLMDRLMGMGFNMQEFIFTAIIAYCDACIKAGPETFDNPMINGEGWIHACREALDTVKDNRSANGLINAEFMRHLMRFPRTGAMMHLVVFAALENVAKSFIKRNRADFVDSAKTVMTAIEERRVARARNW